MTAIALLDDFQGAALGMADWSAVQARAAVTVFRDHLADPDALVARLLPFDAVCVIRERTRLTRAVIERLPNLKFIASTGPRNAAVDLAAAAARGIPVSATRSAPNGAMELSWALILAAARHLPAELASVRQGGWMTAVGGDLRGRTLGIMGLGRIGAGMARVARAFEMEVLAWSQNLTEEAAAAAGARRVDKATLLGESDFVSLHLVLSPRSRGIVGAAELALMKPTAWLVNTSRAPLVDPAALADALRRRSIAGAALDVFEEEPLPPGDPLRGLDNVIATPHIGFVTTAAYRLFFTETVENLLAWLDGSPVRVMSDSGPGH